MQLVPGVYGLRVTATAPSGQFGAEFVNVTVHEEPRENTPPQLVISPSTNYTVRCLSVTFNGSILCVSCPIHS